MKRLLIPGAALAATLALAACGGNSSTSTTSTSASSDTAHDTVAVKSVDGVGKVLVDSGGMALYSSNLDASGKPACAGACTSFWKPLTLASGMPSAAAGAGKVAIVMRSDGTRQVAIDGKPLYTFVQDSPGKVTGNGVSDAFSGRHFTWSAVLAGGAAGSSGGSSRAGGGYSSGGGY
jgi:predicted lipoprotein with Yx(FWY)xxD motif